MALAARSPSARVPDRGRDFLLVADQIADMGGNERGLIALLDLLPDADALSAGLAGLNVPQGAGPDWRARVRITPPNGSRMALLFPLYERQMARADPGRPRVIVNVVHTGWSLGVRAPGARVVCYSAGLPAALYGQAGDYLGECPRPARLPLRLSVPALRREYRRLLRRPDRLIVNSRHSARLVEREAGRAVEVVHPPVRTTWFTPAADPARHWAIVGRLVRQKRIDIAVDAFRGLPDRLVVVGDGPEGARLRRSAPPNVTFTGVLADGPLRDVLRASHGLISTSLETFGIAICEALATGVPVIAPRRGGPLETVRDGETGLLLERMDPRALAEAVRGLRGRGIDPAACRQSVERFSEERFKEQMAAILREELELSGARPGALEAA